MDLAGIYHKANILIAQTYGITGVPEKDMLSLLLIMLDILYISTKQKVAGILRKQKNAYN